MHWVDDIAVNHLLTKQRSHVIASGTSISGEIHVGNAGDIIMGDGIARSLREKGGEARIIWIMDDVDPLRSVPLGIPESFAEHFGKPDYDVPDPWGCHERFTKHFSTLFIESLHEAGIDPEVRSGYEMYRDGLYEPLTKVALENPDKIRKILEEVSGAKKRESWLPFEAICEKCGKIITTHVEKFDGLRVFYRCLGGVAGKKEMKGCGHEGWGSLRNGKLPWRVEWAARWKILGVTCEPFGKEHSAAGGSYDTSKRISAELFDYPPPFPVPYEYILVDGKKMSSSKGNVFTVRQMLDVAPPDLSRFFHFRTYPNKHKEFKFPGDMLQLIEEFERFEAAYYGNEEGFPEKEVEDAKRAYVLSRLSPPPRKMALVPFQHLLVVCQVAREWPVAVAVLRRTGMEVEESDAENELKFERAVQFVAKHLPEDKKFILALEKPMVELTDEQKRYSGRLGDQLSELSQWSSEVLHQIVHGLAKEMGLSPGTAFQTVYLCFLSRKNGPRAGFFLSSLDKSFVVKRLREMGS